MNKNQYINSSVILSLLLVFMVAVFTGCEKSTTPIFDGRRALFFPNEDGQDTLNVSFSHTPGVDDVTAKFKVMLIGKLLSKDAQYMVKVVDSLTTALPSEYEIVDNTFKADSIVSVFAVKMKKSERMSTQSVTVTFEIGENDNFGRGYFNQLTVKLTYDNIESQPLWWDEDIEYSYLGVYSKKKFEIFSLVTGSTSLDGVESWDKRKLCLKVKEYIAKNGTTEEDGSPMIIPCF